MTYKVFWQNVHAIIVPYSFDRYCCEMGVENFTNVDEMLEFADKKSDEGVECFVIDYKAEKGIGELARHINQCYGNSRWSYERDRALVAEMKHYIKKHNFPVIFPVIR